MITEIKKIGNEKMGKRKDFETTDQAHEFFDSLGLREHHTAKAQGYVSRKFGGFAIPYKGRFGEGYKYFSARYDSTYYCDVTYYVKGE